MQQKSINYNNSTISYNVFGKGKPVVFLHGFAEDSSVFKNQVQFLEKNFLVVIVDLPGIGKSTIMQKSPVEITDYAEAIKMVIDEEKLTAVTLIGHSMGGYIALAFAQKYTTALNGLGLMHSSSYADDEVKVATRKKAISFIEENGSGAFLRTSIPGLFLNAEKSEKDINNLIAIGNHFNPQVLIQQYNAMILRKDTTSVLKTINLPVLFIIGEHDKAIPYKDSLAQSHLPAVSYVHILRNSGHMGMLEETEKVNIILAEFLRSV